ncbi:MAG: S-adenosylmethionine:tRNA ribosyltransferase-isomerase [Planctomycetaceae bacterium]|nr:MAG: S-adenosylmethionine:tRNA ribosyltransferase-isomerase [Planctomycetaceae bacterium]
MRSVIESPYDLSTYDYALPPDLIAQQPLPDRSAARLMLIDRRTQTWSHHTIRDLPHLLQSGDVLVANNSRVIPARLRGFRTSTGGKWEGLFLRRDADGSWMLIGRTRGWLRRGETVTISKPGESEELILQLQDRLADGVLRMRPSIIPAQSPRTPGQKSACDRQLAVAAGELDVQGTVPQEGQTWSLLERFGEVPLPNYIRGGQAEPHDRERYQTVYAERPGSVAAPTAGLHFTPELIAACRERHIAWQTVTLHVGLGTFRPVQHHDIRQHIMHAEWCEMSEETAQTLWGAKQQGGRIVAVGTTSLRTLETCVRASGWHGWRGEATLFIYPPYEFVAVDGLLTNFHLPRSTLLMLVCALAGTELTLNAYRAAIAERYRFYSYGDAMLIL